MTPKAFGPFTLVCVDLVPRWLGGKLDLGCRNSQFVFLPFRSVTRPKILHPSCHCHCHALALDIRPNLASLLAQPPTQARISLTKLNYLDPAK